MRTRIALAVSATVVPLALATTIGAKNPGNRAFVAKLSGAAEVPAVQTSGKGTAQVRINLRKQQLCYVIHVKRLSSAPTAAHIHGPSSTTGTAGIVVTLGTPNGGKNNAKSKACIEAGVGDLTLADLNQILANPSMFYANVHTTMHPGGEVRGHLTR